MKIKQNAAQRRVGKLLAVAHILKKQMEMDDDEWRAMLHGLIGVETLSGLAGPLLEAVVSHLRKLSGSAENPWAFVFNEPEWKQPVLKKIYRLCQEIARLQGSPVQPQYAAGVIAQMRALRGMEGVCSHIRMCDAEELRALSAALAVHVARLKKRAKKGMTNEVTQ
ncbi:MAG: regulatory protein GemA [Zoogloeaceae bacterium]|jgi:hypothetical protein|nr:regulatory protein GemA [Zoogloeaceae bacterium]